MARVFAPMLRRPLFLLLVVFLARCERAGDCSLVMVAQMPLEMQDHLLVVPAGINGHWVRLVIDTGAERTTISNAAAEQLGLPHDPRYVNRSVGIGGATTSTDVVIDRLVLGGVHFPLTRIAVGTFRLQTPYGLNADGLLGADILLAFDLDIDLPNRRLTLYRSRTCPATALPWPDRPQEIDGVKARKDRLLLPFTLDDVPGLAILDTGAQGDVVGVEMVRRMGLTEQALSRDPSVRQQGVGPDETISYLHQFNSLRIGPDLELSPKITVLLADFGVGDGLIGETFLQERRVWLSFRNRQIFVSRRSARSERRQAASDNDQ